MALESQSYAGAMNVLSWNLFHGRSVPPTSGALQQRFASMLAGWTWDVALLQEVPPWWPSMFARAMGAHHRRALTSRNALLPLRRAVAARSAELMKSNGGGCNAILARASFVEHRSVLLRRRPERRVAQLARLEHGHCVVNFHGSARVPLAEDELARLWDLSVEFADGAPLLLGGDLNLREPVAPGDAVHLASRDVDHLFGLGMSNEGPPQRLDRRTTVDSGIVELSDHVPLLVRAGPNR